MSADTPEFRIGEGRLSGVLAVFLGALALGGVCCFRYPALFTTPEARAAYPLDTLRAILAGVLVLAFGFGGLSVALARGGRLGLSGLALALAATLLGGADVPTGDATPGTPHLGLDWFLLRLLLLSAVFVPIERAFARRPQRVFRPGWQTDLTHFAVSHLLVQVSVLLAMTPALALASWAGPGDLQAWIAGLPLALQLAAAVVVADLAQYGVHRAFHAVPLLWRFHAIHHSAENLDWLAGSRLHLVDILVTRAVVFAPLALLGFAPEAVHGYLVFVSVHAVAVHANVRFDLGPLRWLLVTPRFHHWHHAREREAWDRNFAVHCPWIDRLFGTAHLPPGRWPEGYGIPGSRVPAGWWGQVLYPFRRRARAPSGTGS